MDGEGGADESGVIARPFLDWNVEDDIGRAPSPDADRRLCEGAELRVEMEDLPMVDDDDIEGDNVDEDAIGGERFEVERDILSN